MTDITDDQIIAVAVARYMHGKGGTIRTVEGNIQIADTAKVSRVGGGAWVDARVWVSCPEVEAVPPTRSPHDAF